MSTAVRKEVDRIRKQKTRRKLLEAAAVVFARKGYRDTLISDIVAEPGMGQGSFYRHFANKREVFDALFQDFAVSLLHEFDGFSQNLPRNAKEYRQASIGALLDVAGAFRAKRELVRLFLREGPAIDREFERMLSDLYDQFAGLARTYLEHAIAAGFARRCDSGVVSQCILGIAQRLLEVGLQPETTDVQIRRLVVEVVDFAFLGIGPGGFPEKRVESD